MTTTTEAAARRALRRSSTDRVVAGVAGGIADATGASPSAMRAAFVVLAILPPGIGLVAYLLAWILLPSGDGSAASASRAGSSRAVALIVGALLVAAGALVAVDVSMPSWIDGRYIGAALLVLLGAGLLVRGARD